MPDSHDTSRVPTNLRLLMILEVLAKQREAMAPSEINKFIGLPKPSIHRLCQTLIEEGFVTRDADKRKIRLARRALDMGANLMASSHLHIARHQILRAIADELGETVNYVVADEFGMRYVDRIETDWPLRVHLPIGTHVPFHCTATGKAYLASLPPRAADSMIGAIQLDQRTPATITDPVQLRQALVEIREQGFSVDHEEFLEEMNGVAVPVNSPSFAQESTMIGALATHAPSSRLTPDRFREVAYILQAGATKIRDLMF